MLRPRSFAPLACLLLLTSTIACKQRETSQQAPSPSASGEAPFTGELPPAGKEVIDLLDGLKPGDALGVGKVVAVGAVNEQGGIPINVFQHRQGLPMLTLQLIVHAKSDDPTPPFFSSKYGVFYQSLGRYQAPMPEDFRVMINEVVERLKRTEDKVPMPKGIGPAKKPGQPA